MRDRPRSQLCNLFMRFLMKLCQIAIEGHPLFGCSKADDMPLDVVARVASNRDDDKLVATIVNR
jgi:hypothetical protein